MNEISKDALLRTFTTVKVNKENYLLNFSEAWEYF
jgi:hypothetical protein